MTISLAVEDAQGIAVGQLLDSLEWEEGVRGGVAWSTEEKFRGCGFVASESNKNVAEQKSAGENIFVGLLERQLL